MRKNIEDFFFFLWLCWVFISVQGLSPAMASGGHSSSRCAGLSPSRPLLLRSTGSRCTGSAIVAHRPSRSTACGIFPDQGSNLCPLHWQADSQPLRHQGSPVFLLFLLLVWLLWLGLPIPCWIIVARVDILVSFLILEEILSVLHHWQWCLLWVCCIWPLLCWVRFPLCPLYGEFLS